MLENSARADVEQEIGLANLTNECLLLYEAAHHVPLGQRTYYGERLNAYPTLQRLRPRQVQVIDDLVRVQLGGNYENKGYHVRIFPRCAGSASRALPWPGDNRHL